MLKFAHSHYIRLALTSRSLAPHARHSQRIALTTAGSILAESFASTLSMSARWCSHRATSGNVGASAALENAQWTQEEQIIEQLDRGCQLADEEEGNWASSAVRQLKVIASGDDVSDNAWQDALRLLGLVVKPEEGNPSVWIESLETRQKSNRAGVKEMSIILEWTLFTCVKVRAPLPVCNALYQTLRHHHCIPATAEAKLEADRGGQSGVFESPKDEVRGTSRRGIQSPFYPKGLYYHYSCFLLQEYYLLSLQMDAGNASHAQKLHVLDVVLRVLLVDAPLDANICALRPASLLLVLEALRLQQECIVSLNPAVHLPAMLAWLRTRGDCDGSDGSSSDSQGEAVARRCVAQVFAASTQDATQQEALLLYLRYLQALDTLPTRVSGRNISQSTLPLTPHTASGSIAVPRDEHMAAASMTVRRLHMAASLYFHYCKMSYREKGGHKNHSCDDEQEKQEEEEEAMLEAVEAEQARWEELLRCSDVEYYSVGKAKTTGQVSRVASACRLTKCLVFPDNASVLSRDPLAPAVSAFLQELLGGNRDTKINGMTPGRWLVSHGGGTNGAERSNSKAVEKLQRQLLQMLLRPCRLTVTSCTFPHHALLACNAHLSTYVVTLLVEGLKTARDTNPAGATGAVSSWLEATQHVLELLRLLVLEYAPRSRGGREGGKQKSTRKKESSQADGEQEMWYVILSAVEEGHFCSSSENQISSIALQTLVLPLYSPRLWQRPTVNTFVRVLCQWRHLQQVLQVFRKVWRDEEPRQVRLLSELRQEKERLIAAQERGDEAAETQERNEPPQLVAHAYTAALTLTSCKAILSCCCDELQDPRAAANVIQYILNLLRIERVRHELYGRQDGEGAPEAKLDDDAYNGEDDVAMIECRPVEEWVEWVRAECIPRVDSIFKRTGIDTQGAWLGEGEQ